MKLRATALVLVWLFASAAGTEPPKIEGPQPTMLDCMAAELGVR